MTTNFDNLQIGPCYVNFKGVDIGLTKGGVDVAFTTDITEITADQFGDTMINQVIKGRKLIVKVPLAENDLTKFAAVFPGTTLVTGLTKKKLVFNAAVGTSLRSLAGPMILHPKALAPTDLSRDVYVALAIAKGDMNFMFKHDTQRVYMLEFHSFVNLDTDELFTLGDPLTAAGA